MATIIPALPMEIESIENEGLKTYYLEETLALDDSDKEWEYEEIPIEEFDELSDSDGEETLEKAVKIIQEKTFFGAAIDTGLIKSEEITATVSKQAEVVDDFIRNFLASKSLFKSLDAFQNEWYEFQQKQKLSTEDIDVVPDVYKQNQEMGAALEKLRLDAEMSKDIANKARSTYDKLRKQRDFHRMHHKRVVQEKNKLISDIKKLKKHYEHYEPTLKQLQSKYEIVMKEKMLIKLEKDRLMGRVELLETTIKSFEKNGKPHSGNSKKNNQDLPLIENAKRNLNRDGMLPAVDRPNPYASIDAPAHKADRNKLAYTVKAHTMAVTAVKFHPKKPVLASVSDDKIWKIWAFPTEEIIMSGQGHKDWISDCDFHPKGTHLATSSGDGTVKIWDFAKGTATLTLSDHTQGVWGCAFHDTGDFIASCSMDHTARLWDLTLGKCKQTFRGHADSVNSVGFQPYTNTLYTCSGDKTISLWDARSAICFQTFYGHINSINSVAFSLNGESLASCDADGIVKLWDIKSVSELYSINVGPQPANKIAFDPSGKVLAVASNSGTVTFISTKTGSVLKSISAGDSPVNCVTFDKTGDNAVVGCGDGAIRTFQ